MTRRASWLAREIPLVEAALQRHHDRHDELSALYTSDMPYCASCAIPGVAELENKIERVEHQLARLKAKRDGDPGWLKRGHKDAIVAELLERLPDGWRAEWCGRALHFETADVIGPGKLRRNETCGVEGLRIKHRGPGWRTRLVDDAIAALSDRLRGRGRVRVELRRALLAKIGGPEGTWPWADRAPEKCEDARICKAVRGCVHRCGAFP